MFLRINPFIRLRRDFHRRSSPALEIEDLVDWEKLLREPLQAASIPNLHEAQQQVDEYIRSGRYDKEVAKVLAAAGAWL
jgi:hypothetical protein